MRILLIACSVFSVFILSCSKSKTNNPPATRVYLKVSTTSTGDAVTYFYDGQGRMTGSVNSNPSNYSAVFYTYNGSTNQVDQLLIRSGSPVVSALKYVYSYDGQGLLTKSDIYDSLTAAGFTQRMYWSFSYYGEVQKMQQVNPGGTLGGYYEFTKNANGNVTLTEQFTAGGVKTYRLENTSFDNKISPSSMIPPVYYHFCANKNNVLSSNIYSTGSGTPTIYNHSYEYDSEGYAIKEVLPNLTYYYVYERR